MTDSYEGEHYRRRLVRALLEPCCLPQPAQGGEHSRSTGSQGAEVDADTIEYFISGVRRRQQQVLPDTSVAAEITSTAADWSNDVDDIRPDGEVCISCCSIKSYICQNEVTDITINGHPDWYLVRPVSSTGRTGRLGH